MNPPGQGARREALSDHERPGRKTDKLDWKDQEKVLANPADAAIMKGLFGTEMNRRNFLRAAARLRSGRCAANFSSCGQYCHLTR